MLKLYDPLEYLDPGFEETGQFQFTSSQIVERLGVDETLIEDAVERAMNACSSMHMRVKQNFRHSFTCRESQIAHQWELSPLACYLTIINCRPGNPLVAEAQVYFAARLKNTQL